MNTIAHTKLYALRSQYLPNYSINTVLNNLTPPFVPLIMRPDTECVKQKSIFIFGCVAFTAGCGRFSHI